MKCEVRNILADNMKKRKKRKKVSGCDAVRCRYGCTLEMGQSQNIYGTMRKNLYAAVTSHINRH